MDPNALAPQRVSGQRDPVDEVADLRLLQQQQQQAQRGYMVQPQQHPGAGMRGYDSTGSNQLSRSSIVPRLTVRHTCRPLLGRYMQAHPGYGNALAVPMQQSPMMQYRQGPPKMTLPPQKRGNYGQQGVPPQQAAAHHNQSSHGDAATNGAAVEAVVNQVPMPLRMTKRVTDAHLIWFDVTYSSIGWMYVKQRRSECAGKLVMSDLSVFSCMSGVGVIYRR